MSPEDMRRLRQTHPRQVLSDLETWNLNELMIWTHPIQMGHDVLGTRVELDALFELLPIAIYVIPDHGRTHAFCSYSWLCYPTAFDTRYTGFITIFCVILDVAFWEPHLVWGCDFVSYFTGMTPYSKVILRTCNDKA